MTTALYRRYRPETFRDVIGQEHVTEPLMQALRTGRVGHAYLFSGPRGCGKTTSARILARCLNCEQGPTPDPCGVCDSCVALARGGAGTVDVIEIDAASHGGVDDARDLRERASYGPAQSRYKVYIIDEAHMVTPQGFNALLKIVEEPPEHVKFVFATTEPEKVIGTIRSRTHHYPFRLVPPARLTAYMEDLCRQEGVAVAPGVLGFVTRAGGGSVRDSLSVLDQLIAGSGDEGLTYEGAASLLGFTDGELLDATIDALAAGDGAAVFTQIDKVIESGHDPRRFVEDLLERLRDLIIVAAVPEGAASVLRGVPEDQLERMRGQQSRFGPGALTRAADIVNAGLTEMTGATAPRMQLELICARILLPAASGPSGYAARLDRLERRLDLGGVPSSARPPESGPAESPRRERLPRLRRPPRRPLRRPPRRYCVLHRVVHARPPRAAPERRTDLGGRAARDQRVGAAGLGCGPAATWPTGAGSRPVARGGDRAHLGAADHVGRRVASIGAARGGSGHREQWPRHRGATPRLAGRAGADLHDAPGDVDVPVAARPDRRLRRPSARARHRHGGPGQHVPGRQPRRAGPAGADRRDRRRRSGRGRPDARRGIGPSRGWPWAERPTVGTTARARTRPVAGTGGRPLDPARRPAGLRADRRGTECGALLDAVEPGFQQSRADHTRRTASTGPPAPAPKSPPASPRASDGATANGSAGRGEPDARGRSEGRSGSPDDAVSDDDENIAPSSSDGRAVVERVLGGQFLGELED